MTEVRIEAAESRRGLRSRRFEDRLGAFDLVRLLDLLLLASVLAAVAYGLVAIDGITKSSQGGSAAPREAAYAVVGLLVMVAAIFIDPAFYRRFAGLIYAGLLGVMLLVLATGAVTRGSKRWISVGGFTFQPSEFGKLLLALCLAAFVADRVRKVNSVALALRTIVLAGIPIVLVFVQPDFGTALVYIAILAAVLFVSGIRWPTLAAIAGVALIVVLAVLWWLPAAGVNVLRPYQAARLTGFTHPASDPSAATYQVTQSITTVGAGGLRGRGIEGATQTNLGYLPADTTDFAFASLAEQRGFLGASILLLLYLLIVWRGLRIVTSAGDLYGAIVAGAISFAFLFQVYVNVGMTIGVAPITGITLPFVSVGGSSMISNLAAMGVLQAIYVRGRRAAVTLREVISLVRAARTRPGEAKPVVVAGARELVPLLAKELRAGGDASAVREGGSPKGASVYIWIGKADEDALRAASRARVPIVGVTDGASLPYVLDTDIVAVRPGAGMPVGDVARAIAEVLGADGVRLAERLPVLRAPLVAELVRREARASAVLAMSTKSDEALGTLALNQVQLAWRLVGLAAPERARLAGPLVALTGLAARRLTPRFAHRLPRSRVVRAALAYGLTRAVGEVARLSVRSGS